MAVFVPIFRLAMLFFNVYDSYKVLKFPPPSASNKGKPSLRAMSQRKRDMKGCLAVWIVWSCFVTYERFAEAIISLFIPFYDEFKSLALLFLIMTRARGAEPIYLHIIRPFLKPYSSTIDQLLDFTHVVGDVAFGMAALPLVYVIEWWRRRFVSESESLDTETEAFSSLPPERKTKLPVNRNATSRPLKSTASVAPRPRQPVSKHSSFNITTTDQKTGPLKAPQFQSASKEPTSNSSRHDPITNDPTQIDGLPQVLDEWRQYPAFPSAYPPTPLVRQSHIAAITVAPTPGSLYPPISEEPAQQDFRQSLLLPHSNVDPSYAGDKSDESDLHGVQSCQSEEVISVMDVDDNGDSGESMERVDEYESEDEFNVTLRTPDTSLHILTSLDSSRPLSSEISPLSLPSGPSGSSVLTAINRQSPLCTPSAETTTPSDASIPLHTLPNHKRALLPTSTLANTNTRIRTSRVVARSTSIKMARSPRSPVKRVVASQRHPPRSKQSTAIRVFERARSTDAENEPLPSTHVDNEGVISKRRRVTSSPPTTIRVTEIARRRGVRPTSTKMTRVAPTRKHASVHPSTRMQTKTNVTSTMMAPPQDSSAA